MPFPFFAQNILVFSLECPKWIILKQSNDFHGHSVQGLRKTRNSPKSTSVGNINLVANKKKLSNPFLIDCEICLETHICFCVFPWVGVFLPLTEAGAVCHFAVICYLQSYYFSSVGAFPPPPPLKTIHTSIPRLSWKKGGETPRHDKADQSGRVVTLGSMTQVESSLDPKAQTGQMIHKTNINLW